MEKKVLPKSEIAPFLLNPACSYRTVAGTAMSMSTDVVSVWVEP